MSDIVINVENISKQYRLGVVGTGTISHDLNRWWARIRGKEDPNLKVGEINDRAHKGDSEYVWALKDINFEVKRGEVLGIIGQNGAGKSTLLKILSRVTAPTTGCIRVKGRIASLLEVGTGFHPELTGRENIYLNGAINGMTKAEVTSKLDEIVEFSGCERYIDTPVKRYSSGMTVRLGFAVAAHLDPEILIVDEVLAVGDAEFQKKCIGKMQDVASHGRTVLFVSHNMGAVSNLCSRGLLLKNGNVEQVGETADIIDLYRRGNDVDQIQRSIADYRSKNFVNTVLKIVEINTPVISGIALHVGERMGFSFRISNAMKTLSIRVGITLFDASEMPVGTLFSDEEYEIAEGAEITVSLATQQKLAPGYYTMSVGLFTGDIRTQITNYDLLQRVPAVEVLPKMLEGGSGVAKWNRAWGNIILESESCPDKGFES